MRLQSSLLNGVLLFFGGGGGEAGGDAIYTGASLPLVLLLLTVWTHVKLCSHQQVADSLSNFRGVQGMRRHRAGCGEADLTQSKAHQL